MGVTIGYFYPLFLGEVIHDPWLGYAFEGYYSHPLINIIKKAPNWLRLSASSTKALGK